MYLSRVIVKDSKSFFLFTNIWCNVGYISQKFEVITIRLTSYYVISSSFIYFCNHILSPSQLYGIFWILRFIKVYLLSYL